MMAKLYWRVKKNGKWTWVPAQAKCPCCGDAVAATDTWSLTCEYQGEEE